MKKREDFHDRLASFITYLGLVPTSFEKEMGFSNGSVGKALNEKRAVGSDRLETIVAKYPDFNIVWLLTGRGEMIKPKAEKNAGIMVREPEETYVMSSNQAGELMIPIADIKAAAGTGYINNDILRTSDFVHLPHSLVKSGRYLCIRIKGSSMSPTLQDGGFVIIRLLDKGDWSSLISDRVYVVSDVEGKTYLKRVRNRFTNGGFIVLTSDNPDKATYPNFNLSADEIVSIWYVEWYLSAKMPNIHDNFYSKLERLENSVEDINRKFEELERIELKAKKV